MYIERDKKREEVWSLKPVKNQLLQGWAQQKGVTGREGEVLATARGAAWALNQPDAYQWCRCDGEALIKQKTLLWKRQHGPVYPVKT